MPPDPVLTTARPAAASESAAGRFGALEAPATLALIGAVVVVVGTALAAANAGGFVDTWHRLHAILAAAIAGLVIAVGLRGTTGRTRQVRSRMFLAIAIYAAAAALGSGAFLSPSADGPLIAEVLAAAAAALTTVTLSVVSLIAPALFLGAAAGGVLAALSARSAIGLRGTGPLAAGLLLLGIGAAGPLVAAISTSPALERWGWDAALQSLGLVAVGYGAATWSDARDRRPRYDALARRMLAALPLIAIGLLAMLLLLEQLGERHVDDLALGLSVAVAMILLVVREMILLWERQRLATEAAEAHRAHIAEIEAIQGQLVAASRRSAVGELAGAVAHEVNNPLTTVLGYSEMLLEGRPAADPERPELEAIRDGALKARTIVRALMEFARPSTPRRMPADLNALVATVLELVRVRLPAEVLVEERYEPMPPVELDRGGIEEVLLNVLGNAIDAMPDGGRLNVLTTTDGRFARVTIRDTGRGMSEEVLLQATTPFFSTRSDLGASGLGLSVAASMVEAHEGSLEISSTPGVGTTVRISIPLHGAVVQP